MHVSATRLGRDYGLTGEEMNRVLAKQGFLQGIPGNYSLTQKALPYAKEKYFHRGTGGYAHYNRYWTTKAFDDSIKKELTVSPDLIREVRSDVAAARAARNAAQAAVRAQANTEFLKKQAAEKAAQEAANIAAMETAERIAQWKKTGKIGLVVGGVLIVGYGVYKKVIPPVKKWWQERNRDELEGENAVQQSNE